MKRLVLLTLLTATLAVAGTALAGGWATVQLSSTPTGTKAGRPWVVRLTVLQHGRTPLVGVRPTITVRNGARRAVFKAVPTGKPGVYRSRVIFSKPGKWTYAIWDGFTQTHTYAPVRILAR